MAGIDLNGVGFRLYAAATGVFSNLSVSQGTVPEPSTMVLGAMGLMGLLAYAWRTRK